MAASLPQPISPQITRVDLIAAPEPARVGKMDYLVTYQAGGSFFQVRIPQEGATPDKIAAAVRQDYQTHKPILDLVGKTL
jgi:hypothetical protein